MHFSETLTQDRRLLILQLLVESPGYTANENLLQFGLADYGHTCTLDQVKQDFAWLSEAQLLTTRNLHGLIVATVTPRGIDVAAGSAKVPGVRRPAPVIYG